MNESDYVKVFTTDGEGEQGRIGKAALGAVTMVGLKKEQDGVVTLNTDFEDDVIKRIVGQPYLNEEIENAAEGTAYLVIVNSNDPEMGYVTIEPEYLIYPRGTEVTVAARPEMGCEFLGWNWDQDNYKFLNREGSYTFTVNENTELTAYFDTEASEERTYPTIINETPDWGTISIVPEYTYKGRPIFQEITITATPTEGHNFVEWRMDGGTILSNPYTTEDDFETLEAVFS